METTKTNNGTNTFLPLIQAFFVLLWSSGAIVIVLGLRYTNPFTFLFYRMVFAVLLMLLISWAMKAPWPNNWNTLKKTIIAGFLTQFLYVSSYFCALFYGVTPTVMTIILALQPLLTAVICSYALKHDVSRAQYIGLLLGLIGVIITVAHDLTSHAMTIIGFIFAMTCLGSITIGSVVQKSNPEMDLRTGSAIQFAVSLVPIFILNLIFGSFKMPLETTFLFALGWMVFVVSVGATCLYYKLLRDGSAVKVNSLFYLVPAVTAVLCYFIFNQPINAYIITGIVLIVAGVLITQKSVTVKKPA